ncbi:glycosyltransferase family 39 protein [Marinilongibacter aquaticus]|uniref:glycosyltransferase family 39 protein n=1 Tax=Marinilongibacter aquaticus TaxID=2975157 RepID=UPI0021BD1508|nr:glycosyltransferase family 39 protein [Marinilongibacter aquaticus]UBM60309.1 glycosyltransferase family 39 protein [Marinilongibacter aquaticus]
MKTDKLILWLLIAAKFVLQFVLIDSGYELHRDEYLHLDQAHHLAWGYLSVPPFTSWISWIILQLGNSVFWVKFFPALFGALTLYVVWKATEALGGGLFAKTLAGMCILFSVLLRLNTLFQPNSPDVLAWTSALYFFILYIKTKQGKWLYLMALVFAFGFLNKYNILFLALGLLPAILLSPQKKLLTKKEFYLALLLAFLLVLPNVIWQIVNNFPVLHHMRVLSETQLVNVDLTGFVVSQIYFFVGGIFVLFAGFYSLWGYKEFRPYRLLFWLFVFTMGLYVWFKAKDYYTIGLYPIYLAFGSVFLENALKSSRGLWLKVPLLALPVLFFILISKFAFPNRTPEYIEAHHDRYLKMGMLRWEDGKEHKMPQDFADMLGWKELAEKVDRAYSSIQNPGATLVLCDNYGQAGAINYYSKLGIRAVTFEADYMNWFDLSQPYKNLIRVKNGSEREREMEKTSPYFTKAFIADSISNDNAREFGTLIFVFENAQIDVNKRVASEIESVRW